MSEERLEKLFKDLRNRLKNEPALTDSTCGLLVVPIYRGGLSGTIKIEIHNNPPKEI